MWCLNLSDWIIRKRKWRDVPYLSNIHPSEELMNWNNSGFLSQCNLIAHLSISSQLTVSLDVPKAWSKGVNAHAHTVSSGTIQHNCLNLDYGKCRCLSTWADVQYIFLGMGLFLFTSSGFTYLLYSTSTEPGRKLEREWRGTIDCLPVFILCSE